MSSFESVSLKEIECLKLLDRIDIKFLFNDVQLPAILKACKSNYKILEINGERIATYKTLYFDTHNFAFYHQHHNGKLNRGKVRYRTYSESDLGFLEVKIKKNTGRTIKSRVQVDSEPNFKSLESSLLSQQHVFLDKLDLIPKIWIHYNRITLVNTSNSEKLTLDLNLQFTSTSNADVKINYLVIAEVKQHQKKNSPFISLMKAKHIPKNSFSKYCFGVTQLFPQIKKNNFKQKLLTIQKITT